MKQQHFTKSLFVFLLLFTGAFYSYAQNRTITGKIIGDDGLGLPGVSIVVKGTTTGTISNVDGNYMLKIGSADNVLVYTSIGMDKVEVEVGNRTIIDVTMNVSNFGLDEVIVVGYGTQKKSDVTGSVVSVSAKEIEDRPRVSVEQMLQGAAAGMNITVNSSSAEGSDNALFIRGKNSINASNSPLIILDGVPYTLNLSELNPRDIASIEVLKDASSTAIYGARGANGVILITTRRGESGELRVNYEGSYSINSVINVPELMDGTTFYETKVDRGLSTTTIEDEGYELGRTTDWIDIATQTAKTQNHNLSFSGGTEKTNFYVSLSYIDAEGVSIGDDFQRYTFRINLDHQLTSWLKFSTNTQYGYYDRSGVNADFEDAFEMNPLGEAYEDDGSYTMETWEDGVYSINPMNSTLYDNSDITRRFMANNSVLLDVPFVEGLSYHLNTGYDYRSRLQQTYRGTDTYVGLQSDGSSDSDNRYDEGWIVENIVSYKREFANHSIFLTGLYSAQSDWMEEHNVSAEGFPNDVMTYYQAAYADLVEVVDSYEKTTHLSQMLRANYAYDSRYLFTATVRRDGYSAFGEDTKFGIFPSVALGWNIANESFMSNIDNVDILKLRLSYGVNGNEAVDAYSTLATLSSENYVDADDGTLYGFYPSSIGDPTLGWESTASFNTGLDVSLLNNRLRGSVDMYWSRTTDLLLDLSISEINGTSSITKNIGETKNNGIELQLSSVNIQKSDFKWTTNFNISHYDTEIVNVGLTDDDGNYIDDVDNELFIGEPISVNYDYVFDGIWQEDTEDTYQGDVVAGDIRYLDVDGDGTMSTDDKQVIGRKIPDFTAGMTNTFQYKNWRLSFFLNSIVGITKSNSLLGTNDLDLRQNRYNVTFWTAENQSNEYSRNDKSANVNPKSMSFYRSTDFLRLQDISLSYRLPKQKTDLYKLNNVEVFMNIKNLAIWTDWIGLDPEFDDQKAVPQTATYMFGVKIGI
jgi:TonB-linked SusC/RagA family outer membrane protein